MTTESQKPARLIRRDEVLHRTGFAKSWLYALIRKGEFPEPIRLGARAVAWREADIDAWIETRPNRSDAA
nr:AlpA family transcriptional regulator [Acidithiobacillus sp.]